MNQKKQWQRSRKKLASDYETILIQKDQKTGMMLLPITEIIDNNVSKGFIVGKSSLTGK